MDGYFNVSSPFGWLLNYTDHTKTTHFHLKSMDSIISLALLSNVATGQEYGDSWTDSTCMRTHALCAHAHFITIRENTG